MNAHGGHENEQEKQEPSMTIKPLSMRSQPRRVSTPRVFEPATHHNSSLSSEDVPILHDNTPERLSKNMRWTVGHVKSARGLASVHEGHHRTSESEL